MSYIINILKTYWMSMLVIMILVLANPFVLNCFLPMPPFTLLYPVMFVVFFFISQSGKGGLPTEYKYVTFIVALFFVFKFIYHDDASYLTRIFFLLFVAVIFNCLIGKMHTLRFIKANNLFLTVQAVLGGIAFILFFVGALQPLIEFRLPDLRPSYFFGLTCSNAITGNVMRPAGFFDEPGALAFWGVYTLVINKLTINDKRIELALIIGLMFTLSMAYYITIALYTILFYTNSLKKIFYVVIAISFLAFIVKQMDSNSVLYQKTLGRFELNSSGQLVYNNRDKMMEVAKDIWLQNLWMGAGGQKITESGEYSADNPYETLATDGIIGTVFIYLPFLWLLITCKDKNVRKAILLLAVGYLQRPFHNNQMHFFYAYLFLFIGIYIKEGWSFNHSDIGLCKNNMNNYG